MRLERASIPVTIAATAALLGAGALPASACDEQAARLAARAYVLSIPLVQGGEQLLSLLQGNRGAFSQDGEATGCLRRLGQRLTSSGMQQAQELEDYSATEQFGGSMPEELSQLPGQVDQTLGAYAGNTIMMGQELLWLSRVLPAAAHGNTGPYHTTATPARRMAIQVMPMLQMLCGMDPTACSALNGSLRAVLPHLERQVRAMALAAAGG